MSATRPATYTRARARLRAPDLAHFRARYPLTVSNFGALHAREAWLARIWEAETDWREALETRGGKPTGTGAEAVTRGAPPASLAVEGEFDCVYAGFGAGLLHAATLAARYGRRVLVFDEQEPGAQEGRVWNLSGDDLEELARAGLLTKDEIEAAVVNRYRAGYVKFHDASSRVKAKPLWISGVMDVALDADKILRLAATKLIEHGPRGSAVVAGLRFVRAYVEPHRVTVETKDARGDSRLFAARLFVDATGVNSPVARQLNGGQAATHVCPTVGASARGYVRGEAPDTIDPRVGEILVSTEDASDHRQLIWEGFAGSAARDEFTTRLFFYDAVESPADKSLLALFERYFERLPEYKRRGAQWKVVRPVFGYTPAFRRVGWRAPLRTADDRVLLLGDGARAPRPVAFGGSGEQFRRLSRLAHLTHLALEADLVDARSLAEMSDEGPRPASAAGLAEFLRPTPRSTPSAVNETFNAVMAALHYLDEHVRRELFLDRMSLSTLKKIFSHTAKLYPRIFARVREHLGARGAFWWLAGMAHGAVSERRGRASAKEMSGDGRGDDAAREFARYLALYKNGRGAGESV